VVGTAAARDRVAEQGWQPSGAAVSMLDDSARARFFAKVDASGGPGACHLWLGCKTRGYGRFGMWRLSRSNRGEYAHRLAYELVHGALPPGSVVMHSCDNPSCVNPAHLRAGSTADNVADKVAKARHRFGSRHCMAKLTEHDVARIREARGAGTRLSELAAVYGVSESTISVVARGITWKRV